MVNVLVYTEIWRNRIVYFKIWNEPDSTKSAGTGPGIRHTPNLNEPMNASKVNTSYKMPLA
jgi:hypothetical protein